MAANGTFANQSSARKSAAVPEATRDDSAAIPSSVSRKPAASWASPFGSIYWIEFRGIKRFHHYQYSSANTPILWPGSELPGIIEKLPQDPLRAAPRSCGTGLHRSLVRDGRDFGAVLPVRHGGRTGPRVGNPARGAGMEPLLRKYPRGQIAVAAVADDHHDHRVLDFLRQAKGRRHRAGGR